MNPLNLYNRTIPTHLVHYAWKPSRNNCSPPQLFWIQVQGGRREDSQECGVSSESFQVNRTGILLAECSQTHRDSNVHMLSI